MTSHTSRVLAPLLAAALAACGGGAAAGAGAGQPTGPAPVVVTPPPAPAGGAPAAPAITKPGPNVTPEGVVFNHKLDGKGRQIYLAGNFNNWNPSDDQYLMKDADGDGVYSITVKLAPGTYQYKYVIESKWTQDPYAPDAAPDGFGGSNSKFDVK
ncbi:MAG TPA: glycogen-binding domain-containing protein [Kofleriaceae bacterium]|nr:glycogen-binding domain-containing protein [Kofleriaceae bacterium]